MEEGGVRHIIRRNDLLFPDLSYKINGVLFDVYKQLGGGHNEKYYQEAVRIGLNERGIYFIEQKYVPLVFDTKVVGKYFLDFLVEECVVLELKRGRYIPPNIVGQVKGYLSALNLQLAIIGCFAYDTVVIKRIVNIY